MSTRKNRRREQPKATEPNKGAGPLDEGQWLIMALKDLKNDIRATNKRLGRVEKVVWFAAGGVAVLLGLIGWVFRPIINAIAQRIMDGM